MPQHYRYHYHSQSKYFPSSDPHNSHCSLCFEVVLSCSPGMPRAQIVPICCAALQHRKCDCISRRWRWQRRRRSRMMPGPTAPSTWPSTTPPGPTRPRWWRSSAAVSRHLLRMRTLSALALPCSSPSSLVPAGVLVKYCSHQSILSYFIFFDWN